MKNHQFGALLVLGMASAFSHAATVNLADFTKTFSNGSVALSPNQAILTEVTPTGTNFGDISSISIANVSNVTSFDFSLTGDDANAYFFAGGPQIFLLGFDPVNVFTFPSAYTGPLRFSIEGGGAGVGTLIISNLTTSNPVSAVPEPETYAMLLAGLGVMGAVARRRKKSPSALPVSA